jgi:dihydrofolate synthase/folylpolyglutamate synthase
LQRVARADGRQLWLDGAHNPAGAAALRAALEGDDSGVGIAAGQPVTLVLGLLADKDCRAICDLLAPAATRILLVPVASDRTARPHELAPPCRAAHPQAEVTICDGLAQALAQAERDPVVLITGSLYLIGEAMELLGLSPVPLADEKALNTWQPAAELARGDGARRAR